MWIVVGTAIRVQQKSSVSLGRIAFRNFAREENVSVASPNVKVWSAGMTAVEVHAVVVVLTRNARTVNVFWSKRANV